MKYLYFFLAILLIGCGRNATSELAQIDSLMQSKPDSALVRLQTMQPDDLSRKSRAYYALLETMAQYKCYKPITSDSVIDISVRYYTDNYDQKKLTQALMYKGAVLAEMGYGKLALDNYKQAEMEVDTLDFMTMGLLNFRLGELYQKSYIKNDEPINRYKKALQYFRQTNNRAFVNNTLTRIGQLYSTSDADSASKYFHESLGLAKQRNDKLALYNVLCRLSKFYSYNNRELSTSKDLALIAYNIDDGSMVQKNSLLLDISRLYIRLGNIDSASYYAGKFTHLTTQTDTMRYNMIKEELAIAILDYKTAYTSSNVANRISNSLSNSSKSEEYYAIDKQFDNTIANQKAEKLELGNEIRNYVILSSSLACLVIGLCLWFLWKRKKRIEAENIRTIELLQDEMQYQKSNAQDILERNLEIIANQNKTLEERLELEKTLKSIAANCLQITRQLLDVKYQFGDNPAKFFKEFDKIMSVNKKSPADCQQVVDIANSLYDSIIDRICRSNDIINESDKLLLSLICMDFGATEIKGFLNLPTLDAVYMARYRLCKKLNSSSLETYILDLKSEI